MSNEPSKPVESPKPSEQTQPDESRSAEQRNDGLDLQDVNALLATIRSQAQAKEKK